MLVGHGLGFQLLGFAAVLASVHSSAAARDIRVQGEAEVQVRPDHVVLLLGVETWNRELSEAREENDRNVASVLAAARTHGISEDDVAVDFAHVEIQRNPQLKTVVDHYTVRRTVVLTLRQVDRFEDVLMAELDAGANYIHNIDFRTSELRRYADEARALAIRAAYEKARDLGGIGGFQVSEQPANVFSAETSLQTWYESGGGGANGPRGNPGIMQNVSVSYAGTAGQSERNWTVPNSGVGYLAVRARLDLEFAIEESGQ
jgi:uncharacterized protein YggE